MGEKEWSDIHKLSYRVHNYYYTIIQTSEYFMLIPVSYNNNNKTFLCVLLNNYWKNLSWENLILICLI